MDFVSYVSILIFNCIDSCCAYCLFSPCTLLWSSSNKKPSWLKAGPLPKFVWPKGSFYFKIVRWIGALGTPHTIKALWEGDRTLFGGCLVLLDFALRATFQVFAVITKLLILETY